MATLWEKKTTGTLNNSVGVTYNIFNKLIRSEKL